MKHSIKVTGQTRSLGDSTPIIVLISYDCTDIVEAAKKPVFLVFFPNPMFMSKLRESLLTTLGHKQVEEYNSSLPNIAEAESFNGKKLLRVEKMV